MRPSPCPNAARRRRGAGFSLAEVVVSLSLFIGLLLGVLFVFNLNYRLGRGRSDEAERRAALDSARHDLVRMARMARLGGLPEELAIVVDDDVAAGRLIGGEGSPRVVAGTDVLTVRGVFSTPLFRVGPADGSLRLGEEGAPAAGAVEIRDPSPQTGVAQSLAELAAVVEARRSGSEPVLLLSQLDESVFAVVDSDFAAARIRRQGDRVTGVTLEFDVGGTPAALAGGVPAAALRGAALVGLLEEYRFYVRQAFAAPGDPTSVPRSQLSVARFVPGTDRPWGGGEALAVDLADDVGDLQVGFDAGPDRDRRLRVEIGGGRVPGYLR